MKKAFTMIELIFVIVIIGLLAGIAIPRFMATRDDAKLSQVAKNITTTATEIAAYTVAKGEIASSFSDMSNAANALLLGGDATQTNNRLTIKISDVLACMYMSIDDASDIKIIDISYGNAMGNTQCITLQKLVDDQKFDIPLTGLYVKR